MWELAGSVARALKKHAANIIFLCGSWLGHWGAHLKMELRTQFSCVWGSWALGRTLKNDAANINFSCGNCLALGRTLKNNAANIIFSRESAGRSSETKILEAAQRASVSDWQSDEFWHFLANFG